MGPVRHRHASCLLASLLGLLATAGRPVQANAEKVIFTAPAPVPIPLAKPSLPDLNLGVLGPDTSWSVRMNLSRVFPPAAAAAASSQGQPPPPHGLPAWLLLDSLAEGQRYELRVCWSALEPTGFTLEVYELDTVWETPELIQSLSEYAYSRHADSPASAAQKPKLRTPSPDDVPGEHKASVLLLRVLAVADYFSHEASLMKDPPPVLVDLILDPYMYNVVPRSLLPTAGYLVAVGIVTWFVAKWSAGQLISIASLGNDEGQMKKQN